GIEWFLPPVFSYFVYCCFNKIGGSKTGNFYWVLKCQEKSFAGPFFGSKFEQVDSVEINAAFCYFKICPAGKYGGEGTFSRAVGAHYCVYFTCLDVEVDTFQNLFFFNACMQVF